VRRACLVVIAACGGGTSPTSDAAMQAADAAATLSSTFRFAVVGDTRPPNEDDLAGYPTDKITKIWAEVEAASPHPDFAISTGDYMFASPTGSTIDRQLDLYLGARAQFTNAVFAAMGNHECTGATASNCGAGNASGITANFAAYMKRMVNPLGPTKPYFTYAFGATDGSWTAKLVFVSANAWDLGEDSWLEDALARPTTYTFVVRHESTRTTEAPGVGPSEAVIGRHPITLRIVGHTHTYEHDATAREVIVGNGGAPLTSGANYGYVIVERLASGVIQVTAYDYLTGAIRDQWRIAADGSPAP
jgi:hypothetical protein